MAIDSISIPLVNAATLVDVATAKAEAIAAAEADATAKADAAEAAAALDATAKADAAEAAALAVAELKAVAVVGSYTGNGNSTQAITGLGITPLAVFVALESSTTQGTQLRIDGHAQGATVLSSGGTSGGIASLDADGFTVSTSSTDRNVNGNSYRFLAVGVVP